MYRMTSPYYDWGRMDVFNVKRFGHMLPFQFIVKLDSWVDSLYMFNGSIDAIRFVSHLLNDFDLQICRKAIYKQRYFQT